MAVGGDWEGGDEDRGNGTGTFFYKAIVQLVLLYWSKIWLVTGAMLKLLEVFHHRSDIRIEGMTAQNTTVREWKWTLVDDAPETARLWPIKEYTQQRQANIAVQVE